jgi:hypothetical protein
MSSTYVWCIAIRLVASNVIFVGRVSRALRVLPRTGGQKMSHAANLSVVLRPEVRLPEGQAAH